MCFAGAGGIVSAVVSGGASNYQQIQNFQQQSAMSSYQNWLAKQQAAIAERQGQIEQSKADEAQGQRLGRGLTAAAAGGTDLSSGSVSAWAAGMASEHAEEKALIAENAGMKIWGFQQDSAMARWQKAQALHNAQTSIWMTSLGMTGAGAQAGNSIAGSSMAGGAATA